MPAKITQMDMSENIVKTSLGGQNGIFTQETVVQNVCGITEHKSSTTWYISLLGNVTMTLFAINSHRIFKHILMTFFLLVIWDNKLMKQSKKHNRM